MSQPSDANDKPPGDTLPQALPNPPQTPAKPLGEPTATSPSPNPPPLTQTALGGAISEREAALARRLKDVETRNAELSVENEALKAVPKPPSPAKKKSWFEGGSLMDD